MKQKTFDFIMLLLAMLFAIMLLATSCTKNQAQPQAHQFKNGEILLPDYVHTDTLIVTDADLLNYLIERDNLKTDGSISDILCITTEIVGKAESLPHSCRWPLCPYKNVKEDSYREAVIEYTGEDNTDAYALDMLHLLCPDKDYEELEQMLNED